MSHRRFIVKLIAAGTSTVRGLPARIAPPPTFPPLKPSSKAIRRSGLLAALGIGVLLLAAVCYAYGVQAQAQEVTATMEATGENPPAAPDGLQAAAEHDAVTLSWTASTDGTVTHYAVLRRNRDTDALGVFHVIEDNAGPELTYADGSVSAESRYGYRVKAVSPTGVSQWSSYAAVDTPAAPTPTPTPEPTPEPTPTPTPEPTPQPAEVTGTSAAEGETPPAAPEGLEAKAEHDAVTLTWTASTDVTVTHYAVLRRNRNTDAHSVFHVIEVNAGPGTSYTDESVSAESRYGYRVKAVSPTGVSRWSGYADVDTPPAPTPESTREPTAEPTATSTPEPVPETSADPADLAPSGLTARAVADAGGVIEGVALAWDAPAQDAASVSGYEILRAQGDGDLTTLAADSGSTATAYLDATATEPGQRYAYRVKAIRGGERSLASNETDASIPTIEQRSGALLVAANQDAATTEDTATEVPVDWSLKPNEINPGERFRLLFVSSATRDGQPALLTDYDSFIQGLAAAGHADIRDHSSAFQVLGSSETTDARDHTSTTYTADDKGVPIFWLNGNRVADDYEDFYDGDWDDERSPTTEKGNVGSFQYVATGSTHDGVQYREGSLKNGIGQSFTLQGELNNRASAVGPLQSTWTLREDRQMRFYGLSGVFQAGLVTGVGSLTAVNTGPGAATITAGLQDITEAQTVHLRHSLDGGITWEPVRQQAVSADDGSVSFNLSGLKRNGGYAVEASLDGAFPVADTFALTFVNRPAHLDAGLDEENDRPLGLWMSAETMWVADQVDNRIYAYNRSNGSRNPGNDFEGLAAAGNKNLEGIWSDGDTMFVVDSTDDQLYAYRMTPASEFGERDSAKEFSLDSANNNPRGVWGNAATIWVSEDDNPPGNKIFAYHRADGSRDPGQDFDTPDPAGNDRPGGIWSDGQTMWLADSEDDLVYAYRMSDRARVPSRDVALVPANGDARDIWSDGDALWVLDPGAKSVFAYYLPATASPTIGIIPVVGLTMTADVSAVIASADIPDDVAISYQWLADDRVIEGATAQRYTLTDSERGAAIRVWVNLSAANGYAEGPLTSEATGLVAALNYPATGRPVIAGQLQAGETLTAETSAIADGNGIAADVVFSYQWFYSDADGDTPIEGATGRTYAAPDSDDGQTLRVQVGFTDADGFAERILSSPAWLSTLITEAGFEPRGLLHHTNPVVVDGVLLRIETFLTWMYPEQRPRFTYSQPDHGFERFEVQTRARCQGSWSAWTGLDVPDPLPRWGPTRNKLPVEHDATCELQEWRIRALYEQPSRHSIWITGGK